MPTINNLISVFTLLGVGGVVGAFINHLLQKSREIQNRAIERKIKSYSNLIDGARAFIGDPTLDYETALVAQQEFIKKFHNDILLYASDEVIKSVDRFFGSVSISYSNKDESTDALFNMIAVMRSDLGLSRKDLLERHKVYTVNIEDLKKKKIGLQKNDSTPETTK